MKTGFWLVIFAVFATAAWATDINPYSARCALTDGNPALCTSGEQLKDIWLSGSALNGSDLTHISTDDGTKYDATSTNSYHWRWIMVKLNKSGEPQHSTTTRWEAYTDSYFDYPCYVYVWNNFGGQFDAKDTGAPTEIFTTAREFSMLEKYWTDNGDGTYDCIILVDGYVVTGYKSLHVDVVDADY